MVLDEAKAKIRERARKWREKNREKVRGYRRRWRDANREKHYACNRLWHKNNADKIAAWRTKNIDRVRAYRRKWKLAHQGKAAAYPALGELRMASLLKIDAYAIAKRSLPAGVPDFVRVDVIADIMIAHLEGRLGVEEIPAKARDFLRAHYREFGWASTLALDEVIRGAGRPVTYLDRLAAVDGCGDEW